MNYDELPAYAGQPPRSNGRAVIRSTNATATAADVTWDDMSATLGAAPSYPFTRGIHPDQHAVVFASADPGIAFVGSDGGVVRIDVRSPRDASAACATRRYPEGSAPLAAPDLADCQRLLAHIPSAIDPINDGLNTIQFQSLSNSPSNPTGDLLGRHPGQRHVLLHGLADVGGKRRRRRRPVRVRLGDPVHPIPQLLRCDAGSELPRDRPEGVAGDLRSAPGFKRHDRSTCRSSPTRRSPVGRSSASSTLAHGRQRRRPRVPRGALQLPAPRRRPCGDWKPMGNSLTIGSVRTTAVASTSSRPPGRRATREPCGPRRASAVSG